MTQLFQRKYRLVLGFGDSLLDFSGLSLAGGDFLERAMGLKDLSIAEAQSLGLVDFTDELESSRVNLNTGTVETSGSSFGQGFNRQGIGTDTTLSTVNTTGYTITDYQMTAELEYDKNSNSRRANTKITLYNLPLEVVDSLKQPLVLANLYCGYQNSASDIPLIAFGRVKDIVTERDGKDIITSFTLTQSLPFQKNSQISFGFPPNTDSQEVMTAFLTAWRGYGVPTGFLDWGLVDTYVVNIDDYEAGTRQFDKFSKDQILYRKGVTFEGELEAEFSRFCDSIGMKWNIFAGTLYVYSPQGVSQTLTLENEGITYDTYGASTQVDTTRTFSRRLYTITEDQVIGKIGDYLRTTFSNKSEEKDSGLTLRILLESRLIPNTLVRVDLGDRSDKTGDYIISSVRHRLNYRGNDWYTELDLTSAELLTGDGAGSDVLGFK